MVKFIGWLCYCPSYPTESPGIIDGHVSLATLLAFLVAVKYAIISFVLLQMCLTAK